MYESVKIGKWLESSFIMRPLTLEAEILLLKMLSIRVALCEVIRLGFEIRVMLGPGQCSRERDEM